ncbi:MAG TPA: DNA-binding transcriptional regulator [Verrucomicrobiota bacterium]|nr:DNA-binding transcriptional regulator [Verrucomicrobiota bacterium]
MLLVMGWYDYRVHRGIARYAESHGWHLCPDTTKEKVIPWGWDGDGILAWLGAGDDLAEFVLQARKPTVDFSFRRPHLPFPRVLVDHAAVAQLVADHFLSRGLSHFAFYSDAENWAFEETGGAFVEAVEQRGRRCARLAWHRSPKFTRGRFQWRIKREWLTAELRKLSKPLGVCAATDDHAVEVLEACENGGMAVPEEVAIVGVDNSLLANEAMRIPISSVDTNLEEVGFRGAALLDELMQGRRVRTEPLRIPPAGLIVRRSSDLVAIDHPGVARSLRFLLDHCHQPIGVDDMARAAGMSRRALHAAFLERVGRTPGAELHRLRIERAKMLLADRERSLDDIAESCGYQSANSLWVAFKHATGVSPRQYRQTLPGGEEKHPTSGNLQLTIDD